jgi:hypothetical protein
LFELIKKTQHDFFADVFNRQFVDCYFYGVGCVTEQEPDGIAVSQDGID